ncbi:MAG: hypothetical protein LC745_06720 [Planctomycetia bacterium]|nr:hypothetical protein [Planctomycetia bacterium]
MTEFTKLKITFALALMGTLFALHPFLDRFSDRGFLYLGFDLKMYYAYFLTAGLLSLCVYLYAVTLMSDRPHSWCEKTGNSAYALAILVVPVYAGLFLSAGLADWVALSHVAWAAPAVAIGLGGGWVVLSQLVAWRIRRRLGEQDRAAKLVQLATQEVESLNQARELFAGEHYDLSVVESWRALEARLRQVLLHRHITVRSDRPGAVVHVASKKGILREPTLGLVEELRRHWAVALSAEPLPREAAVGALSAVRHVLAVIPVEHEPASKAGSQGSGRPSTTVASQAGR